jgi:D-alanyl-lipoteichoic acid acyltransferase DltB (MBOAT superfamily)
VFKRSLRWQNVFLLIASYFFYGWWSYKFLGLLVLSTFLDYIYGFSVASPNKRKAKLFLWLSIVNNLGILAVFKYYNFFALQLQHGLSLLGLHTSPALLHVVLPIGISFYTFHGMSYVFDIYREKQKPVSNFIDYAVFVSFFPLLVAGPIERANHLLPQVQSRRIFRYGQAIEGCRLILWGMVKKVVIADNIASNVDAIFNNHSYYGSQYLLLGVIGFSFQIYCDFSGYSDIAIGTAKLLGFELLSNFKFPYFSRDIAEFWRRWHISLSSWFRDYLYIPLGGSREGKLKAVRNTFIIFLVSGFWHGARWNFIVWGFIHACAFLPMLLLGIQHTHVLDVAASKRRLPSIKELFQMLSTFIIVGFGWIYFRAANIAEGNSFVKELLSFNGQHANRPVTMPEGRRMFFLIIPFILIEWWLRRDERSLRATPYKKLNFVIYVLLALVVIHYLIINNNKSFIYFEF